MQNTIEQLIAAEKKAAHLFAVTEERGLIICGKSEKQLNQELFELAFELLGIRKYWHKRIVRSGKNTLLPYRENPPDLLLTEDDILFFDFGPVFEEWEADFGRTYVIGNNPDKLRLKKDIESAWEEGKKEFLKRRETITGSELYHFTCELAKKYGWEYGNEHCGHLVGNFPHEKIVGEERIHYIHPENHVRMMEKDQHGNDRHWIYEIHFVDHNKQIGGFFEQLLF